MTTHVLTLLQEYVTSLTSSLTIFLLNIFVENMFTLKAIISMLAFQSIRVKCIDMVAAHLRTFLKECGSFAHTFFPGKRFHLRTQFPQVNVTFVHIRFSQVNGMTSQVLNFIPSYTHFLVISRKEFVRQMAFKAQSLMKM